MIDIAGARLKFITLVANALLFQCLWWVCTVQHDASAWYGALIFFCVHFYGVSTHKREELIFIVAVAALGIGFDTLLFGFQLLQYEGLNVMPHWLVPLWLAFAATLAHSLFWLWRWPVLAAGLGAFFGPASYWLGASLSPVSFSSPSWIGLMALALFWAILLPLSLMMWQRRSSVELDLRSNLNERGASC